MKAMKTKQKNIEDKILHFEYDRKVSLDGFTYVKGVNDISFYLAIELKRLKLTGK